MVVNGYNPNIWKRDIARSVDMYDDWFSRFASDAYRTTRIQSIREVETTSDGEANLTDVDRQQGLEITTYPFLWY